MTDTRLVATVYKVLTAEDWQAVQASGMFHTAVDRADGFVHLSTTAQLPLTLARYFSHAEQVMLIAVDSKVLAEKMRFETAVGSDRAGHFPHYYGELSVDTPIKSGHLRDQPLHCQSSCSMRLSASQACDHRTSSNEHSISS